MDKNLLKRATEDTEDPTPGYMFRDIAQWTFLDQATQSKLIQYLMDKLKPSASVHVLAKVLRIIKILCETGHTDFQKEMQKRSDDLKQFASFRGKPDPKYGDKLNEKVRTTAKEAIDAAFTHRREVKSQIGQGMGSDTTFDDKKDKPTSGGSTFTTGNVVTATTTGSGHSNIAPMPTTNKWAEHMAKHGAGGDGGAGSGVMNSAFAKDIALAARTGFGLWQENVKTDEQRMFEAMNSGSDFRPVDVGFGGGFAPSAAASSSAEGASWKFTDDTSGNGGAGGFGGKQETQTKILTPFQVEVERIAALKATPQRVDLSQFVANCEQIGSAGGDWDDLTEALDERLQQKYNWQQRLNVLAAVEALLRTKTVPADVADYFTANPEDIQRNVHVVQTTLKEKAAKVLQLLNIPVRTAQTVETSAAQNLSLPSVSGGGTTWASGSSLQSAPQAPATSNGGAVDFGGLEVKSKAKAEKAPEDKTKLKKRAAMNIAAFEDSAPPIPEAQPQQQQQQPATAWGTSGGWGFEATSTSTTQQKGGWDSGFSTQPAPQAAFPMQTAPIAPAPAQQPPRAGGFDEFDSFFASTKPAIPPSPLVSTKHSAPQPTLSSPLFEPPVQHQQQPPMMSSAALASPPANSGPAQGFVAPPPSPNVAGAQQMILQMQQQLQTLMSTINLSDPNAAVQMQMMMQQQQQLMALIAQQSQVSAAAAPAVATAGPYGGSSQGPAVVPHGSFQVSLPPPRERSDSQNQALAAVQQEMMMKMMNNRQ